MRFSRLTAKLIHQPTARSPAKHKKTHTNTKHRRPRSTGVQLSPTTKPHTMPVVQYALNKNTHTHTRIPRCSLQLACDGHGVIPVANPNRTPICAILEAVVVKAVMSWHETKTTRPHIGVANGGRQGREGFIVSRQKTRRTQVCRSIKNST